MDFPDADYPGLHAWSVRDLDGFWSAIAEFFAVSFHDPPTAILHEQGVSETRWFPGSTLNYAEHALAVDNERHGADLAVVAVREDGSYDELSRAALRTAVGRARAGLVALGVTRGDRVVAVVPNSAATLIAFLAAASLGAIWSSCSPDFGADAVHARFGQVGPSVLFAVDGHHYGGKTFDDRAKVAELIRRLPTLQATVLIPCLDDGVRVAGTVPWDEFLAEGDCPLEFDPVPFDHPLWIVYSSGTTGAPKGILHGHGGIVLEHLKMLGLHNNLAAGDRFFWFTTTGWMMWNYLVSGLLVGATVVLYDGSSTGPDHHALWRLAEAHRVTLFGVSAPFIQAQLDSGTRPAEAHDLSAMQAIGSTGSPLSPDAFRWIGDVLGPDVQICSISGGTDVCTAFLCSAPTVPVWLGELSCAALGAAVAAVGEDGRELLDEVGELVLTRPMPSMPVAFWNDPDGSRLRQAYFTDMPGMWRHGDWVRRTPRGSFVIHGRSDSTLNRGGVRMGTAEFYAVVETHPDVVDSLVVDTSGPHDPPLRSSLQGLLCFVVLAAGASLPAVEAELRDALRRQLSPRHVPDRILAVDAIPRTLSGKKCEIPVKRILTGSSVDAVMRLDSLSNPDSVRPFVAMAALHEKARTRA